MRRIVIDTNVFVDWFNAGRYEEIVFQRDVVRYLSSVVLMELLAGASSRLARRHVERLEGAFEKGARILTPSASVFRDAGHVLRRLKARGYKVSGSHSIVNDVLIALSARSIGATVATENEGDFRAIHEVRPFRLLVV